MKFRLNTYILFDLYCTGIAYTMAKYGMSMCVLGMSEELKPDGIAVNALWPRTGTYIALYTANPVILYTNA